MFTALLHCSVKIQLSNRRYFSWSWLTAEACEAICCVAGRRQDQAPKPYVPLPTSVTRSSSWTCFRFHFKLHSAWSICRAKRYEQSLH